MESGTIVRESAEAVEQEAGVAAIVEPEAARPPLRGYLALVCMSALLKFNGEAEWGKLKDVLADNGVASDRAQGTFKKTLRKTGKVVMDGKTWKATEAGVQFVAKHTDRIDESYEKASEKKIMFTRVKYTLFKHMQEAARPDGWLLDPANETSAIAILADNFGFSHRNLSRNLYSYNDDGLIDQQRIDNTITNVRLNEKGKTEMEKIKTMFPDEVAALEAKWTIEAMRTEIDNMCYELGEGAREFKTIQGMGQDELDSEIDRLAADMRGMMSRLDARKV